MSNNPVSFRLPPKLTGKADPAVVEAIGYHDDAITDLQQAIPNLKAQIDTNAKTAAAAQTAATAAQATATAASSSSSSSSSSSTTKAATIGAVNDQTGNTTYTTTESDYGGIIVFNDASPVSTTLNVLASSPPITLPWYTNIANYGAGAVTITPASGTINGAATLVLSQNQAAIAFFDGTNWDAIVVAAPGAGGGVTSLNGETGAITLTSTGATVTITTPTTSTINLEVAGGSGSFLVGNGSLAYTGSIGFVNTTVTVTGATTSMYATVVLQPGVYSPGTGPAIFATAAVTSANTVTVWSYEYATGAPSSVAISVLVFS